MCIMKRKISPDKAKKMYLACKILIPVGAVLFVLFIVSLVIFFIPWNAPDGDNPYQVPFLLMLCGPIEIGAAALVAGIILLVIGKKALPNRK
ncbi:hypothetical protein FACS1894218_5180 [Bacilli bacterium]|nr:hypothetical protein FACS1894218_5180 [Bacilli bacterium]